MNLGVAGGAASIGRKSQVMKTCGDGSQGPAAIAWGWNVRVTFQTDVAHFCTIEHPRIGRTVILMTGTTTFHPDWSVFKGKRPSLVGVTLKAARLGVCGAGCGVQPKRPRCAVRIMAVHARHRALRDRMGMRSLKGSPGTGMATGAKLADFARSRGW